MRAVQVISKQTVAPFFSIMITRIIQPSLATSVRVLSLTRLNEKPLHLLVLLQLHMLVNHQCQKRQISR